MIAIGRRYEEAAAPDTKKVRPGHLGAHFTLCLFV